MEKCHVYVYAENEADAIGLAYESENRESEEFEDGDQDGTNFDFNSARIKLNEEVLIAPELPPAITPPKYIPYEKLPDYFLAELQLV